MSSSQTPSESGSDLSRSTPLVTIPSANAPHGGVRPAIQQQLSDTSDNHPLQVNPPPVNPTVDASGGMSFELSQQGSYPVPPASYSQPPPPPTTLQPPPAMASPPPVGSPPQQSSPFPATSPPPNRTPQVVPASPAATLDDLADTFLAGESPRKDNPLLRPPPLSSDLTDLDRLRTLAYRRAWGDVVALATQLLKSSNSHYATLYATLLQSTKNQQQELLTLESQQEQVVEILTLHCQALLNMRRYPELKRLVEEWRFCHHHHSAGSSTEETTTSSPDWIPWDLHILAASTLQYTSELEGGGMDAVDALWRIRADIPDDDVTSRLRLDQVLSNVFCRRKQYRMALKCLQQMMDGLPQACQTSRRATSESTMQTLETVYRCEILSRQGRILLQAGAVEGASQVFTTAATLWKTLATPCASVEHDLAVLRVPAQLSVNQGLLSFAHGKYDEALEYFHKASTTLRQSDDWTTVEDTPPKADDSLVEVESLHVLYSETMNNIALCAIYSCRLQDSVNVMESLIREGPTLFLTERVALNLWYVHNRYA